MDNYEDMILPDDFVQPQTNLEGTESKQENINTDSNTDNKTSDITNESTKTQENISIDNQSNQLPEPPQKIKIKYNHVEQEITLDEASPMPAILE